MSQLKQLGAMTRLNIRLQLTDPAPTLILTVIRLFRVECGWRRLGLLR